MNQSATNPNKEIRTTTETYTVYNNIVLEGTKFLRAVKEKVTFKITREFDLSTRISIMISKKKLESKKEPICFELVEITPEEVIAYRRKRKPSFVMRVDGKLYYTTIPRDLALVGTKLLGTHMCAQECSRQYPLSYEEGGCEKVRNFTTFIERYPWITKGYETFGTKNDCFVVAKCLHYRKPQHSRVDLAPVKKEDNFESLMIKHF